MEKSVGNSLGEKDSDDTKYESISHYFQQQLRKGKITEPYVDDITWNDLDWMRSIRQWITRLPRWEQSICIIFCAPRHFLRKS